MTTRFVSPGLGYEIEERPVVNEGSAKNQKLQRAISEMGHVPGFDNAKRSPVTYGHDGLPNVPDEQNSQYNFQEHFQENFQDEGRQEYPQQQYVEKKQQMAGDPGHSNQPRTQNYQVNKTREVKHPVVEKLLSIFGLVNQKRYDLKIFSSQEDTQGMEFTLTPITDDLASWALEVTRQALDKDNNIGVAYYESLLCCSCVLAIDKVPIYEVFNINQTEEEKDKQSADKYSVTSRVRKLSGKKLLDILWTDTKPILIKLTDFYEQTITKDMNVKSSLDIQRDLLNRYVCPVDGCSVIYFEKSLFEDNSEVPYYCKVHSAPMVKSVSGDGAEHYPLA